MAGMEYFTLHDTLPPAAAAVVEAAGIIEIIITAARTRQRMDFRLFVPLIKRISNLPFSKHNLHSEHRWTKVVLNPSKKTLLPSIIVYCKKYNIT
jgi:hypothetical protein